MQGFRVAKTMIALVLAIGILQGLGFSALAGVELGSGGVSHDEAVDVSEDMSVQEVEDHGPTGGVGNFGITTGVTSMLMALWTITVHTAPILISWGVPGVIAYSVHAMVVISLSLAVAGFLRGVRTSL